MCNILYCLKLYYYTREFNDSWYANNVIYKALHNIYEKVAELSRVPQQWKEWRWSIIDNGEMYVWLIIVLYRLIGSQSETADYWGIL